MPSPKSYRRGGEEKNRKGRLAERASSFHGQNTGSVGEMMLRRPRTVPDLRSGGGGGGAVLSEVQWSVGEHSRPKLTKLLLKVTIQRSLGAVQVVMPPESTVEDLIAAAVRQYAKEGRRPILPSTDPAGFDLHYSQFSLESLNREEKLVALGSRNLYLCPRKIVDTVKDDCETRVSTTTSSSCSKQADEVTKTASPWFKFMDFLL